MLFTSKTKRDKGNIRFQFVLMVLPQIATKMNHFRLGLSKWHKLFESTLWLLDYWIFPEDRDLKNLKDIGKICYQHFEQLIFGKHVIPQSSRRVPEIL